MFEIKRNSIALICALTSLASAPLFAAAPVDYSTHTVTTIDDFNEALPIWGVSWKSSNGGSSYHTNFYTGFSPRSQYPNRIHVRQSRGNITRMTVVLDETTVSDYIFDLVMRNKAYNKLKDAGKIRALPDSYAVPTAKYFDQIVNSPAYGIASFVEKVHNGEEISEEEIYTKSLEVLDALNPKRIFHINLNLTNEFKKWAAFLKTQTTNTTIETYLSNNANQVIALNTLVWGRINYVTEADAHNNDAKKHPPSTELIAELTNTAKLALADANSDAFLQAAVNLFKRVTGDRYDFRTVRNGQWVQSIQCSNLKDCRLVYPEFTTIMPTGTWKNTITDRHGNKINHNASTGLQLFYFHKSGVGRINMGKPYYGYAPWMGFHYPPGNAYHNPGLRFADLSQTIKNNMNISNDHRVWWSVKRGAVSSGCSRLAHGHAWEMRHILPTDGKAFHVNVFVHKPQDFDLFDMDGDGNPEVPGVDYYLSYHRTDASKREANVNSFSADELKFYENLLGKNNVFRVSSDGKILITNPKVSFPSYLDFREGSTLQIDARLIVEGEFNFFDQKYEQDKVQMLASPNTGSHAFHRLFGRIRGCAPSSDKAHCGENAFKAEARTVWGITL